VPDTQPTTVAALYVDVQRGPYAHMPGVDAWGVERDAKSYAGSAPVVSHPPCGPWGKLRFLCTQQDATCGPIAVGQVRAVGGVLEHPEGSVLWAHQSMPLPAGPEGVVPMLAGREWTLCVDQCRWGHPCQKRTWLFFVGVNPRDLPPLPPRQKPTHCIDDGHAGDAASKGLKHLPKTMRHITPPAFAEWLVACARAAT
jgi:hypothetical protein